MTVWGTSAGARNGRNGNEEWTYIDNVVKGLNGGYGHKARRSYDQKVPTNFNNCPAASDIGKRVSAFSIHTTESSDTGWLAMANGNYDSALRSLVNSVPSGHKVYLIYSHEPENDGGSPQTLWRPAWARFAKVVLDCGNSNVVPTFNLMAYTWDAASRNPNDYNPARNMTSAEVAACLGTVDAYTRPVEGLFGEPYADIISWGFRGFGIMEMGQADDPSIASWMLDVEDWVNAHPKTEIACWWHSGFAGSEQFWLDTTNDGLETWADIIGRNQGANIPVTQPPVTVLPPSSGTGNPTGTPVVTSGNTGGYSYGEYYGTGTPGWTGPIRVSQSFATGDENWPLDDNSVNPVVAAQSDGSALVVWQTLYYQAPEYDEQLRLGAARVTTDGVVTYAGDLYTASAVDTFGNDGMARGWPLGENVFYVWDEVGGTRAFLVGPDATILTSTLLTTGSFNGAGVDSHCTIIDDTTLLWCNGTIVYKLTVTPSGISSTQIVANIRTLLGSDPVDPVVLYYSPTDGKGIAWSTYMQLTGGADVSPYTWSWNGSTVVAGTGPHTLTDGSYNFDSWSQFLEGQDGYLYFLPSAFEDTPGGGNTVGATTRQRLYRVTFSGDTPSLQQKFDLSPAALHGGERPPYGGPFYYEAWMLEVNHDGQVTWTGSLWLSDQAIRHADSIDDPATTVTFSGYMYDPLFPLSNGIYTYRADGDASGGIWGTYFAQPSADDTNTYVGVYKWGAAAAIPNLAGEYEDSRRKFTRSQGDYGA